MKSHAKRSSKADDSAVTLTHPEKILYPESAISKEDLARYYTSVADHMLPYITNRPLVFVRCPAGIESSCFFQKHPGQSIPDLPTLLIKEKTTKADYGLVESQDDLLRLVQANVLEIHCWGSHADAIEFPDQMIFDLDPAEGVPRTEVLEVAFMLRDFLKGLKLESFARLTGGKGIHVVIPLQARHAWEAVKEFTRNIATTWAANEPNRVVAVATKEKRKGKIFIDYLRNDRGATAIANYSTRAKPHATVALPVTWEEIRKGYDPEDFTIQTVPKRLAKLKKDPWDGFFDLKQTLPVVK
jgi:bifunctional non-homologous end joining protein LigD